MTTNNLIYALRCPFTDEIHYVGKTTQGLRRPMQHLTKSHSIKIREWVNDISELGYTPKIDVLEKDIDIDELDNCEKFWIGKCLDDNCILLNSNLVGYNDVIKYKSFNKEIVSSDLKNELISSISVLIKSRRRAAKLSQEEFAIRTGFGLVWIRKVEQKCDNVRLTYLIKMLSIIGYKLVLQKI